MTKTKKYIGKLTDDAVMSCSRLPALMNQIPQYSTPNDELKKSLTAAGRIFKNPPAKFSGSEPAQHGNNLEGYILETGAERLALKINAEITEKVCAFDIPLQGSLDGILFGDGRTMKTDKARGIYCYNSDSVTLDGPGVAEAKLTRAAPTDYAMPYRGALQCQGLQICTGYKWHAIFTLFQGTELRIFLGNAEPATQAKIRADVLDFQSRMDLSQRDGVTDWYSPLTRNDAASIYNISEPKLPEISLSGQSNEDAISLIAAKAEKKQLEKKIEDLESKVMDVMGLCEVAYVMEKDKVLARLKWPMLKETEEQTRIIKARKPSRGKTLRIKEY